MVDGMDLSLIQSSSNITSSFNASNTNKNGTVIYAKKGDPMYQKDMDADEDGVVTFEEFNNYCDENDISYSQRKTMLQSRLNYQLNTERTESSEQIRKIESKSEAVYAEEGDDKYNEEIDSNNNGKITYNEYLKYCEEQENSQNPHQTEKAELSNDEEKILVKNEGKAINQYAKSETEEPDSKIEEEA